MALGYNGVRHGGNKSFPVYRLIRKHYVTGTCSMKWMEAKNGQRNKMRRLSRIVCCALTLLCTGERSILLLFASLQVPCDEGIGPFCLGDDDLNVFSTVEVAGELNSKVLGAGDSFEGLLM